MEHRQHENELTNKEKDPFDGEYIGNIWGWKFSRLSFYIILFIGAVMLIRYCQVADEGGFDKPASAIETDKNMHQ